MAKDPQHTSLLGWLGFSDAPDWRRARPLGALIGALLVLLFIGAFVATGTLIWRSIFAAPASGPNLGTGALLAAILGAPFLIWGTVIRQKHLDFEKEGHLTDRISKAVEQLGAERTVKRGEQKSDQIEGAGDGCAERKVKRGTEEWTEPNIEVRIGGLLSLERIAQDSTAYDKGRDHAPVMEILCAYIRTNAPASRAVENPLEDWPDWPEWHEDASAEALNARRELLTQRKEDREAWIKSLPEPRADIALALRIIGRRNADQRRVEARWGKDAAPDAEWVFDTPCPTLPELDEDSEPLGADVLDKFKRELENWKESLKAYKGYRLDLRASNLQCCDMSQLVFSGAGLDSARMEGSLLAHTRLEGAILNHSQLQECIQLGAIMNGAMIVGAELEGARSACAQMIGANLSRAHLEDVSLGNARMEGAELTGSRMEQTYCWKAQMEFANFGDTRMASADFSQARLEGANFRNARMMNARLWNALLWNCCFERAGLEGADLSDAYMQGADMRQVKFSENTTLRRTGLANSRFGQVDLSKTKISQEQVRSAFGDASVTLPSGIFAPSHWPNWEMGFDILVEAGRWLANPDNYTPPDPPEGYDGPIRGSGVEKPGR